MPAGIARYTTNLVTHQTVQTGGDPWRKFPPSRVEAGGCDSCADGRLVSHCRPLVRGADFQGVKHSAAGTVSQRDAESGICSPSHRPSVVASYGVWGIRPWLRLISHVILFRWWPCSLCTFSQTHSAPTCATLGRLRSHTEVSRARPFGPPGFC